MQLSEIKWCNGQAECAGILGIDVKLIQVAKRHPAFQSCFRTNGRCSPTLIQPLLEQYKDELENAPTTDDTHYWKGIKTKYDALISQITFEELEKKYLKKDEVLAFLKQIGLAQKAMLKSKLTQELPSKLLGLSVTDTAVEMEKALQEICEVFNKGLEQWNQ